MITVNDILTNYLEVRSEYLRLESDKKEEMFNEFKETVLPVYEETPLDNEMIDIYVSDHPHLLERFASKITVPGWNELILGPCDRVFHTMKKQISSFAYVPHSNYFIQLSAECGYELSDWNITEFILEKNNLLYHVFLEHDAHCLTLRASSKGMSEEERVELTNVLHKLKEMIVEQNEQHASLRMIFVTGAFRVDVCVE